jgi:GcrA cell cycle regulator
MTWTDARIAQLTRLWNEGVSAAGIAEALGDVSRSAVLGKLHRLRLLRGRAAASAPRRYEGPVGGQATAPMSSVRPPAGRRGWPEPPEPPKSPWCEAAFAPLPGAAPRNWLSRAFGECAFPVGGDGDALMSCCAPVKARSAYCATHHAVAFRPVSPAARAAEQRRWAEAVVRWAA